MTGLETFTKKTGYTSPKPMTNNHYLQRSSQKLQIAWTALLSFAIFNKPITDFSTLAKGDEVHTYLFLLQLLLLVLALVFSVLGCRNAIQSFRALEPYRWEQVKVLVGNYIALLVCWLVIVANGMAVWRLGV